MPQMSQPPENEKIARGPLREFVEGHGSETRATVIVEAATGPLVDELPRVGFGGVSSGKVKLRSKKRGEANAVDELGEQLEALTGRKPTWLKYADAYVVDDLTPDQVRQIASWSQTAVIRPNRLHTTRA